MVLRRADRVQGAPQCGGKAGAVAALKRCRGDAAGLAKAVEGGGGGA